MKELLRAFVIALRQGRTYRNGYTLLGFLWGLPVPAVTLGIHLRVAGLQATAEGFAECLRLEPIHWLFLMHPILFAVVFGAMGTMTAGWRDQATTLIEDLKQQADTDGLTGLLNHRAFQVRLREEAARARRQEERIALAMIDLDRFKEFNDANGHPAGDEILRAFGARLKQLVRPYDVAARYGGEEFALVFPNLESREAAAAVERIRKDIAARGPVTLSAGVAARIGDEPFTDWIERADAALYRAKARGRNRVCASESKAREARPS